MRSNVSDRVLVAVDATGSTDAALQYASREAVATSSPLELVHVVDESDGEGDVVDPPDADDARKLVDDQVPVRSTLLTGPVEDVLVELSHSAHLLVVQHHRLSRLRRLRGGSVAVAVAGRVSCRMVCVPDNWRIRDAGTPQVTVGIDAVDAETSRLLEHAFHHASRLGGTLRVVHAWSMSSAYDDALVDAETEREWSTQYQALLHDELEARRAGHPGVSVVADVLHRAAAKALVDLSAESDLLLVGQGRLVHPLVDQLGSVTRAVLMDSECPVEVVTHDT